MRAISALKFEAGISTSSRSACRPLRMRVRKSAIGSVSDISLPARLGEAGDHALVGDLADADAAEPELAQVGARAPAALAAVVVPRLVLGPALLADPLGCLCHYSWVSSAFSAPSPSPSSSSSSEGGASYASGFSSFSSSYA